MAPSGRDHILKSGIQKDRINPGEKIHFSFRRYVTNVIREEFGFQGTPIKLHFKERS